MKAIVVSLSLALASVFGASAADTAASRSGIFPNPQQETVGATAFNASGATFRISGGETADADAVRTLGEKFDVSASGSIEIIIGEKGDDAVGAFAASIPSNPQGYYLKTAADKVVIAGTDSLGTYYGVQSFIQLMEQGAVPAVEVIDWPDMAVRGVIEGYYGNPWSFEDIDQMIDYFDRNKMNTFIYGPKNDRFHHGSNVFDPYPTAPVDTVAIFREIVAKAKAHKVDIIWAMHPGNSNDGANLELARKKFEMMYEIGFRHFAVFFDDISANSVEKQVDFLNYMADSVACEQGGVGNFIVCPSQYNRGWAGGDYLPKMGEGLYPEIDIMWTGAGVVDMELGNSCDWFKQQTGRYPYIWHNYPCSDYGSRPLLLCPYEPAAADLYTKTTGFTANPMEYFEASKVGLYGMADFAWNAAAYDPWEAWEEAIQYIMPEHADAFRTYCLSNFNYPAPKTHGGPIIYQETPDFKALIDAKPFSTENAANYKDYFNKQLATADELLAISGNRLVEEINEWLVDYRLQALRALTLIDMREQLDGDNPATFTDTYATYKEYTAQADSLVSRDFKGSLRRLYPFCGSQFVEPFITNNVEYLIEEFKALGLDYPAGLFPERIIQTGLYHILYEGKYLTNVSGSGNPTFKAEVDNVNPNRQVWKIAYVPETGRYSLTSAEDDRYVNEIGNFGTNPYDNNWNTYNLYPLNGLWAIQNAGKSGQNYWSTNGNRLSKGARNSWNLDNFMFQIVPAGSDVPSESLGFIEGDYTIADAQGNLLTRSAGNQPKFTAPSETVKAGQKWTLTIDPETKRIKICNASSYLNENGVFGTNQYYPTWNTYEIYLTDGKAAIRNAGEAGNAFWVITDEKTIGKSTDVGLIKALAFRLSLIDALDGIREVVSAPADASGDIYDLQGRRVVNPRHGIYIINGKKISL